MISLCDAKAYLCIDSSSDDTLISDLLPAVEAYCAEAAKLTNKQQTIPEDALRGAELYALGYLYGHLGETDHYALLLALRSIFYAACSR